MELMCITSEAGGFRNHFRAEKKKEKKTGSNVATFQCHDVSTSRRLVNRRKSQRTSQRRDVPTSRRHHDFCLIMIKSKRDLIGRHRRTCDWSAENRAATTQIIRKDRVFVLILFS